jgi:UDP-3-O-[3-hydroxymyristoyl] glucosamine N-acyltransferase
MIRPPANDLKLSEVIEEVPGSLVYCATLKFLNAALSNANVAAIITTPELGARVNETPLAITPEPRGEFFRLYRRLGEGGLLRPRMDFGRGIGCRVHGSATLSERCRIGDRVVIEANAVIGEHVWLEDDAYVGQGAMLGVDGLMPLWRSDGAASRFSHCGSVVIGRNVVVLAGTAVVTSVFQQPTTIASDTFIGLFTTIGHDSQIGSHCVIGGNCVIGGGVVIEDGAQVWASASIAHGCRVGRNARVQIGAVVVDDVPPGRSVFF